MAILFTYQLTYQKGCFALQILRRCELGLVIVCRKHEHEITADMQPQLGEGLC